MGARIEQSMQTKRRRKQRRNKYIQALIRSYISTYKHKQTDRKVSKQASEKVARLTDRQAGGEEKMHTYGNPVRKRNVFTDRQTRQICMFIYGKLVKKTNIRTERQPEIQIARQKNRLTK